MRSRNKTLAQNVAVVVGFLAILGFDAWFAASYVTKQKKAADALTKDIQRLNQEWEQREAELKQADQKADSYVKAIASRMEELKGYGEFLPPSSDRPVVQEFLLQTIEDLQLKILKTQEIRLTRKAHYSTLDVALTLRGSYRDFKLLLARIYKSKNFIRVKKFDVLQIEDDQHMQEVEVQFETYFSNSK